MVAVVAGNGLGLFNTSLNTLGAAAGSFGQGNLGQAGGKAWVNASTGNLILRFTDEQLSGLGQDLFHTRTYNALGALNDADGDGWRWDGERRVVLSGAAFTAGSSLSRTTGDGHQTVYAWNGSRYQSSEGDGAHDFIQWDTQTRQWYWTDGLTRSVERYDGDSGLLNSVADTQGTLITYGYQNGKLASVTDSSGQALVMVYNAAGKLARLDTRSSATGPLTSQVYYTYDGTGRLLQVETDLTPDDNDIGDGNVYTTSYTYDGSSFRIASIRQSDDSSASFTYQLVGSEYRVKTVVDSSGTTTFTYDVANKRTGVSNALNQQWSYFYDALGQLSYVQSPTEDGQSFYTGYQYDADGNLTRITDNNGNAVSYFYDERGNRVLERDPKGVTVARTFNAANQVLSEIHYSQSATWYAASGTWAEPPASSAQVTRYVYDYADRLRFVVSATGNVVEYTYEGRGLRAQEIVHGASLYPVTGLAPDAALGESALAAWSLAQDPAKTRLTAMNYDYRGNLILRVTYANVDSRGNWLLDSAAELTRYVYNDQGQLLQTLAGRGADRATPFLLSSTAYDGMGRVIGQMDANGARTTVYNRGQRSIVVTTASGLTLTQLYDLRGRLVSVQETAAGSSSRTTSYYYDTAGRLNMKQDATGVRTFTFYDQLGRVGAEVDGTGAVTRYSYNQNDQRISTLRYATLANTSGWFNGSTVTKTLAQILPGTTTADRLTRFDYDSAGRLLNSIDGAGTVTSYEYDGRGQRILEQTGQRVTRFFFDADGRQVGQIDAEGYLRENLYDAAGRLQQVLRYANVTNAALRATGSLTQLRPAGASLSVWSFYDGAGRQIGSIDEQGFVTETVYNEGGNAQQSLRYLKAYTSTLSTTSAFAEVRAAIAAGGSEGTVVFHDELGRISRRVVVDGTVTTFEYDAAGRLVKETSAAGTAEERSTRTLYDAFGQTIGKLLGEASERISAGMSQAGIAEIYRQYGTTWSYDAAGRMVSVTDAMGNRTVSYYDAAGRLSRVINAAGEVSETKYNAFGDATERSQLSNRLTMLMGVNGGLQDAAANNLITGIRNANLDNRTTYGYDTRGLLLTSIDAEGISTTNQYDAYGQLQRQIRVIAGSRTVTSAFGYNLRGERISQTRDAGGLNLTDTTAYDAFGRVIRSTDAAGNVTSSEYQNNGRTVVVRDPLNNSRRTELDAFGRSLKEVDALGNVTTYSYDDVNRSIVVTMPDGTKVSTWKTRNGETLKVVNAKGDTTQYEYNRDGQLTRTIDALGQAEIKRYDKAGRLSESVDARGIVTVLGYDAANRVMTRRVDPAGLSQTTSYQFDALGRQILVSEFSSVGAGRTTSYRYDRKGQLLQTIIDPTGQLQLSTRYSYDALGNVVQVSQGTAASPAQRVTDYVYDALGQRRFSIDALGYVTQRSYDAVGNVIEEVRYANKLEGPRDTATLQALGVASVQNSAFGNPDSTGIPAGWSSYGWQSVWGAQASGETVSLSQTGRGATEGAYVDLNQSIAQVKAGQRYAFSADTAVNGADAWVVIVWFDASGNSLGWTNQDAPSLNRFDASVGLNAFKRIVAEGVAPAGAVSAQVIIRKMNTLDGYGDSQLLTKHPEFTALPVLASADDRVTSYAYDALGRQRFSIDALGYVSERSYDAAGNIVEEVRYANRLQGPRDAATLRALGAGLQNASFASADGTGIPAGWSSYGWQSTWATLASGETVSLYQSGRGAIESAYVDLNQSIAQVRAGQRYAFSADTAVNGADAWAVIVWFDASGNSLGWTNQDAPSLNRFDASVGLNAFKRIVAEGVAPAGAVSAQVIIRKMNTLDGYGDSQLLTKHPEFTALPVLASADDRVTSYTYDALGRQRFSIDALGYVSERSYDAVGNVVEEVRYANKLQGPRDVMTLRSLLAGGLQNSSFSSPCSTGIPAEWSSYGWQSVWGTQASGETVSLSQTGRGATEAAYVDLNQSIAQVKAGQRYAFSVDTAVNGADAWVVIVWFDASGNSLGWTNQDAPSVNSFDASVGLNAFKRIVAEGVAPSGATSAQVIIRKMNTLAGYGDSQLITRHPEFKALPVVPSADDRVTSHVYDALGRQRWSIDAMGYVSERSYDASGNVLQEVRYANRFEGARDVAALRALGSIGLQNPFFASPGSSGVPTGWSSYGWQSVWQTQSIGQTVSLSQTGRGTTEGAYVDLNQDIARVQAGQRYSFSAYTAIQGADAWAVIVWFDASGNSLGWTSQDAPSLNHFDASVGLNAFKRIVAEGVAPSGAASAQVIIRKMNTLAGYGDSQLLTMSPEFKAQPVVSSADDRVTNYVYDALGRQRFSIDALGYVAEQAYDTLGNVLTETRYANRLQGERDALILQKLETQSGAGSLKQSLVSSADRVTRKTYDSAGRLKTTTDPLNAVESYGYDAFGNRTSLTNRNGQTWTYGYDQAGQLVVERTPVVAFWAVNSSGQLAQQIQSLSTTYTYDAFGSVITRSEGGSRTTAYGYDGLGRQVRITSPGWYNKSAGQFQESSDGSINTFQITTEVTYDSLGNAVRNRVRVDNTGVDANDYVDSYKAYDLLGRVRYEVDALKGVTVHELDDFGQEVLTRRHALPFNGGVSAKGYYQVSDFTATTLPASPGNDRTILTRYDRMGRKTEVQQDIVSLYSFTGNLATSALKSVAPTKVFRYNSFGEVTRETLVARDINGASVMEQIGTVNYYDRAGQRVGSVDALGYYTRLEYDANGKVSRQVEYADALGAWSEASIPTAQSSIRDRSIRFSYDKADRLVQTTRENVSYWKQSFSDSTSPATMTLITGDLVVSRSTYDGVGNLRTLTDAAGSVTSTEYNALGQVVKVTEPARYSARVNDTSPFVSGVSVSPIIEYGVNAFGQVVSEKRSAGWNQAGATQTTITAYDAAGYVVRETDAANSTQVFKVDVAGRRVEESRTVSVNYQGWKGSVSQTIRRTYDYDKLGQQLATSDWYSDAGGQKSTTRSAVYNRFGEITAELLNGNHQARYTYNQIGNVIEQTNAQGVTSLSYDLTGKVSRSAQLGDLVTVVDDRITYMRNDLLGRVLEQHLPAFEVNVAADTLNSASLVLTTPIVRQISDRWGNVLNRTDARGYVTRYSYDHNNQVLTETLPEADILRENGTSYRASLIHERRYDAVGLLVEEADLVGPNGNVATSTLLRTRQHVYNAAGDLVRDIDELGASRHYLVDAHGNRVGTKDSTGIITVDEYDAMDRHVRHAIMRNGQRVILSSNLYDQAGRLYAEIDGTGLVQESLVSTAQVGGLSASTGVAGNTRFSLFDERGNIVATRNESNIQKTFVFSEANRKVAEIDGLANSLTWTYNEGNYGRLTAHKDLGNRNYSYVYNAFGQVLGENSDKTYAYYANGLLKSVSVTTGAQRSFVVDRNNFNEQWKVVDTSIYAYDLVGNKVSEALTSTISWSSNVGPNNYGTIAARQESRYRFDETGRLADARMLGGNLAMGVVGFTFKTNGPFGREHIYTYSNTFNYSLGNTTAVSLSYKFDEFGNRRRVTMDSLNPNGSSLQDDNWFKYDLSDRAVIVDGFLDNGAVVAGVQGGLSKGYTLSYDSAGRRSGSERWQSNASGQALYVRSEYTYNDLSQVASRSVRNVYRLSGANSNAVAQSVSAAQMDLINGYDERGRVVTQTTYKNGVTQSLVNSAYRGDNQKVSEITYSYSNGVQYLSQASYFGEAGMFDAAGNQTRYRYAVFNTAGIASQLGQYQTNHVGYESYKAATLTAMVNGMNPGVTTYYYSARGDLLLLGSNTSGIFRRFAVDADGRMVGRQEGSGAVQNYLYYQNTSLANAGRISVGTISDTLVPISADYPAHAPSSYLVNQGDTFESIAQAVWGDRSMWYLIADANGRDLSDALVAGSSLRIPNVVSSNRNDATTFKPYNPAEMIGDTITPPTAPKPKKKKCNAVASVVMIVVAVVATIFTAGAGLALAGGATLTSAVGVGATAVIAGGIGVGLTATSLALGAVAGSLVSQSVGKAMGVVDKISWKQAAVAGLGSYVGAGIADMVAGASSTVGTALTEAGKVGASWQNVAIAYGTLGAASYTGSYIVSKAVGLDNSFSWKNMAASAVGSIVGGSIKGGSGFWNSAIRGQISAHSTAWIRDKWFGDDSPDYGQVAADAFGNSLVNHMVEQLNVKAKEERARDTQREIAEKGVAYFTDGARAAGASPEQIKLLEESEDLAYVVKTSQAMSKAYEKYGKPYETLSRPEQESVLESINAGTGVVSLSTQEFNGIYLDQSTVTLSSPTWLDRTAGVLDSGANAVNQIVLAVGGEDAAAVLVTGIQAAIYGVPKTALQFVAGTLLAPLKDDLSERLSGVLQERVFNGEGTPESVRLVSDTLARFAVDSVFDTGLSVVKSAAKYAVAKKATAGVIKASETIGQVEAVIGGRKRMLRIDIEPHGKLQIQSGRGKDSIVDFRPDLSQPLAPQINDEFKRLPKSVREQLIRYAEKGLRKLEETGNM